MTPAAETTTGVPEVGTKVAHFLRVDPPEWVDATVIDHIGPDDAVKLEEPFDQLGTGGDDFVHLEIKLDRRRHGSSSARGYRLNVARGDKPGQWLPEKPKDADKVYAEAANEKRIREQINQARARGEEA